MLSNWLLHIKSEMDINISAHFQIDLSITRKIYPRSLKIIAVLLETNGSALYAFGFDSLPPDLSVKNGGVCHGKVSLKAKQSPSFSSLQVWGWSWI